MDDEKKLPSGVDVPTPSTVKAMKELEAGKGKRFPGADELFEDIGARGADSGPAQRVAAERGTP